MFPFSYIFIDGNAPVVGMHIHWNVPVVKILIDFSCSNCLMPLKNRLFCLCYMITIKNFMWSFPIATTLMNFACVCHPCRVPVSIPSGLSYNPSSSRMACCTNLHIFHVQLVYTFKKWVLFFNGKKHQVLQHYRISNNEKVTFHCIETYGSFLNRILPI